jgi:ATP-dependent Lon protease
MLVKNVGRESYHSKLIELKAGYKWVTGTMRPAPGHLTLSNDLLREINNNLSRLQLWCIKFVNISYIDGQFKATITHSNSHCTIYLEHLCQMYSDRAKALCPICGVRKKISAVGCVSHQNCAKTFDGLFEVETNNIAFDGDSSEIVRHMNDILNGGDASFSDAVVSNSAHKIYLKTNNIKSSKDWSEIEGMGRGDIKIDFLDRNKLEQYGSSNVGIDDGSAKRAAHIVKTIIMNGFDKRNLIALPENWRNLMNEFIELFPNFKEFHELLVNYFALSDMGDKRFYFPPILLLGDPGIGKTEVTKWLSTNFNVAHSKIDISVSKTGSELCGSESYWSNTDTGKVFKLLTANTHANPIIVLDEVDKGVAHDRHDPIAPLHTLLENSSAKEFTDLSVPDFWINASHVNWIATANTTSTISAPILSRMIVLTIPKPTKDQLLSIVQKIYSDLLKRNTWGGKFEPVLEHDVAEYFANDSQPRSVGINLVKAMGAAANVGRRKIVMSDIGTCKLTKEKSIGFI